MKKNNVKFVAESSIVAALYVALTWLLAPISYGAIQFRISEALMLLVLIKPSYALALIVGCFISNTTSSLGWYDMVFGTLATVIGILPMLKLKNPFIASIFPVLANGIIVAVELYFALEITPIWLSIITVGLGEAVVIYLLGIPLLYSIKRNDGLCEMLGVHFEEDSNRSFEFMSFLAIALAVLGAILFFAYPMNELKLVEQGEEITKTITLFDELSHHWWVVFLGVLPVIYALLFIFLKKENFRSILCTLLVGGLLLAYICFGLVCREALKYAYYYGYAIYLVILEAVVLYSLQNRNKVKQCID